MLTDLRNRGILDVCIVCCDGLKGLPEAIVATWPQATVQTCVVHLVRNSLRYASKKVLGPDHARPQTELQRPHRRSGPDRVRSVRRHLGTAVSGDGRDVATLLARVSSPSSTSQSRSDRSSTPPTGSSR